MSSMVTGNTTRSSPSTSSAIVSPSNNASVVSTSTSTAFSSSTSSKPDWHLNDVGYIGIGAGAVALVIFIILICIFAVVLKRRRRKEHPPPTLPKLTPSGLTCEEGQAVPRVRYQKWPSADFSEQRAPNDDEDVVDAPSTSDGYVNPNTPAPASDPVRKERRSSNTLSDDQKSVYVNMGATTTTTVAAMVVAAACRKDSGASATSGTGSYIMCLGSRPDSMPTSIAPGFDGRLPLPASPREDGGGATSQGVFESWYMPMNLGSLSALVGVRKNLEGIYTVPDEARGEGIYTNASGEASEDVYSAPDQPPPRPCGLSGSRRYVNVPESDDHRHQQRPAGAAVDAVHVDKGEYQNLSQTVPVYGNLPQSFTTPSPLKNPKVLRSESLNNMVSPEDAAETLSGPVSSGDRLFPASSPSKPRKDASAKPGVSLKKASSMSHVPFSSSSSSSKLAPRVVCKPFEHSIQEHKSQPPLPRPDALSDSDSEGENYENLETKRGDYINVPEKKEESKAKASKTIITPNTTTAKVGIKPAKKHGADSKIPVIGSKTPASVGPKRGTGSPKPAAPSKKPTNISQQLVCVNRTAASVSPRDQPTSKHKAKSGRPENKDCSNELQQILAKRRQNNGES